MDGIALHCFPEESTASTFFEQAINAERKPGETFELYGDLDIPAKMQLDPVVVDVLRNRDRLELFVKARVMGLINTKDDGDLYVYPKIENGDYRLSKMSASQDRDNILSDLVYDVGRLAILNEDPKITNRMRLFYALRTFVLLERDLENENRPIDFDRLEADVAKKEAGFDVEALLAGYDALVHNYKSFYAEYGSNNVDNLIILAHLGLVLAKVAYDCYKNVNGIHAEDE